MHKWHPDTMNSSEVYVATVARTTVISSGLPPEIGMFIKRRWILVKIIIVKCLGTDLNSNRN